MENEKDNIKKIVDCYSQIVSLKKVNIKGWKINQHVISETPYVKIGITEPVFAESEKDKSTDDQTKAFVSESGLKNLRNLKGDFKIVNDELDSPELQKAQVSGCGSEEGVVCDSTCSPADEGRDDSEPQYRSIHEEERSADAAGPSYTDYYKDTQEQFKTELLDARLVFYSKLNDYGASWRILRPASVTDQLEIKATRIRTVDEAGITYVGEGIYPEFQAIVNYGIVALIQLALGPSQEIDFSTNDAMEWYDKIMYNTFELMCRKNVDYHEAWRMMRVGSYTDFILVKLARIKQIEENHGRTTVSEGIDANYMDIINYAVFALIKLKEEQNRKNSEGQDR